MQAIGDELLEHKRQSKARLMNIDGYDVLRTNNYTLLQVSLEGSVNASVCMMHSMDVAKMTGGSHSHAVQSFQPSLISPVPCCTFLHDTGRCCQHMCLRYLYRLRWIKGT